MVQSFVNRFACRWAAARAIAGSTANPSMIRLRSGGRSRSLAASAGSRSYVARPDAQARRQYIFVPPVRLPVTAVSRIASMTMAMLYEGVRSSPHPRIFESG